MNTHLNTFRNHLWRRVAKALVGVFICGSCLTGSPAAQPACFPAPWGWKWCGAPLPITIRVDYGASLYLSPSGYAIQDAIETWDGSDGAVPIWNFETTDGNCIPIRLTTAGFPTPFTITARLGHDGLGPCTYAETTPAGDLTTGALSSMEITFNDAVDWTSSPDFTLSTVLHEFGHAFAGVSDDWADVCDHSLMYGCSRSALLPACTGGTPCRQTSAPTSIDSGTLKALRTIYGDLCNSVCGVNSRRFFRGKWDGDAQEMVWHFGTYTGCVSSACPSTLAEPVVAFGAAAPLVYELAISDSTGGYSTFASLSDSVWNGGRFAQRFTFSRARARFRLRVVDGAAVIEESYSYPPVDIVAATTAVNSEMLGDGLQLLAWPNPSRGKVAVEFTLMNRSSATVELIDVLGRRVDVQEVGHLGPGRHVVSIIPTTGLTPGVYLVRVKQGARISSRKIVWER